MHAARWLLCIACAACAAGGGPSRVRDIDGRPLPSSAVSDASGPVHMVECRDGNTYMVVVNRPPFHRSARMESALRDREKSLDDVCDRILAAGP